MTSPINLYTFYDEKTKIWKGLPNESQYNSKIGLGELIIEVLRQTPEKVTQISVDSNTKLTCAEQRLRSIRVAQNLTKLGYKEGDVISIVARNGENLAAICFGCFLIAAPINTLDPTFGKDDLSHMLGTTKPKLIFCDPENVEVIKEACEIHKLVPEIVLFEKKIEGYRFVDELLVETGNEAHYV